MIIVKDLEQNSPEWYEFRKGKLGASDSNIIMGDSKFKTPKELWLEKTGKVEKEEQTNTFITDKGHYLESKFRPLFELEIGYDFPAITAIKEGEEWLSASLDGYSHEMQSNLEMKYCGELDFQLVRSGKCIPQYKAQINHQLMVTGADRCFLFVVTEEKDENGKQIKGEYKYTYTVVEPDLDYIKNELYPSLVAFRASIIQDKEPALSKDDVLVVKNKDLGKLLTKYKKTKVKLDELTKSEKELKKSIFDITKNLHNRVQCGTYSVTETVSKSSTKPDYEKWFNDFSVHMEPEYYKEVKGRKTQKITFKKD